MSFHLGLRTDKFEISFFAKFCFTVSILLLFIVNFVPDDFISPSYGLVTCLLDEI
jgi:hypothetical protein